MAFASKTLTPTQSAYSNIERETLAIDRVRNSNVPLVPLWKTVCCRNRPQASVNDIQQAAEERTATPTATPAQDSGVRSTFSLCIDLAAK